MNNHTSETTRPASQPLGGTALMLAGAAMISFSAVFVKLAHVGPTMAGFYRMLFGGLLLAGVVLAGGHRPRIRPRDLGLCLACAVFFALDLSFWHRSIHYVGPGLATILSNFQVFFLAGFGAAFFGEKLGWRLTLAIPLALAGLYLLVGVGRLELSADYRLGLAYGGFTAMAYAAYLLTLRRLQAGQDGPAAMGNMVLISLVCALILGLEAWAQGESFAIPDLQSWASLLGYGLAGQVLGWVLISKGLPRAPASQAGLVLLLQPTLSFVWDMLFFARPTDALDLVGACGALAAIYLGTSRRG